MHAIYALLFRACLCLAAGDRTTAATAGREAIALAEGFRELTDRHGLAAALEPATAKGYTTGSGTRGRRARKGARR